MMEQKNLTKKKPICPRTDSLLKTHISKFCVKCEFWYKNGLENEQPIRCTPRTDTGRELMLMCALIEYDNVELDEKKILLDAVDVLVKLDADFNPVPLMEYYGLISEQTPEEHQSTKTGLKGSF